MSHAATPQPLDPHPLVERRLTFGTYRVRGAEAADAVRRALDRGVRRVDTAQLYKNEDAVYGAIRAFEAAHPEAGPIHVCSKIRANLLFADTVAAVEDSVQRLGRPLDSMLLHRPLPHIMWRALDACVERGLVGEIGLSNYPIERIAALLEICAPLGVVDSERPRRPAVHQAEIHPFVGPVFPLLSFCRDAGIRVQGHTMLARGEFLQFPPLRALARTYGASPAVIMLRWAHQLGVELVFHTQRAEHLDEVVEQVFAVGPIDARDMAEISGYHSVTSRRFFQAPPLPLPDPELDAITDTQAYVEAVVARLVDDMAALEAGRAPSPTAATLPTRTNREIMTDPTAQRIAERLFPARPGKGAASSHHRYRDLLRALRSKIVVHRAKSCSLPADHLALQAQAMGPPPVIKGRPVSPLVAFPAAMPVEIAPADELEPFFRFLADPDAFVGGELSTPVTFRRGTYFPDQRMDLCKQVVGPDHVRRLCDAVEEGYRAVESEDPELGPLTFRRGTYFPDQRMDLCKQVVGPTHVGRLCDAVAAQPESSALRVRHFLLGNNIACDGEGTAGAEAFAGLMRNPAIDIETWYLAGNAIGPADMEVLADGLTENTRAKALWLKRNPLGVTGGRPVGRMLGANDTLELLDLHNTGLFDRGVVALAEGLAATGAPLTLKHLYLSANALTEASLDALAPALGSGSPEPSALVSLYLSINRLGAAGVARLVELMQTGALGRLERLDLGSNGLDAGCLGPLVDALLAHCPRLRMLDLGTYLSTRDLGEEANQLSGGVEPLERLLAGHPTLELLDLSICGLSDAERARLVGALRPHQSLHGIGGHALQHDELERRLLKHPAMVLHIDSVYRGKA